MKTCCHCKKGRDQTLFHLNKSNSDGLHKWCKICRAQIKQKSNPVAQLLWQKRHPEKANARNRLYKYLRRSSCPLWANRFFMEEAYCLALLRTKLTGFLWHVDHIVPLNNPLVCGLHNEFNLQVIPAVINLQKGNKWN
jgi:hypothetical protein